ncbi:MAG: hypothetical protein HC898_03925 [Phycisphaerales bacterium]|nr:hypothetical protein [Phycisphaerales bacterium]
MDQGFLRGDQYAIALALVENGQVVVGALACPWSTASSSRPAAMSSAIPPWARARPSASSCRATCRRPRSFPSRPKRSSRSRRI